MADTTTHGPMPSSEGANAIQEREALIAERDKWRARALDPDAQTVLKWLIRSGIAMPAEVYGPFARIQVRMAGEMSDFPPPSVRQAVTVKAFELLCQAVHAGISGRPDAGRAGIADALKALGQGAP